MSNNLVYLLSCNVCGQQYCGETARTLAERISEHEGNIIHRRRVTMAQHFYPHMVSHSPAISQPRYSALPKGPHLTIKGKIHTGIKLERLKWEIHWSLTLRTFYPDRINHMGER